MDSFDSLHVVPAGFFLWRIVFVGSRLFLETTNGNRHKSALDRREPEPP